MKIQKTLFNKEIIVEYTGKNVFGEIITIPNFQPVKDNNPRLDMENKATKRNRKR